MTTGAAGPFVLAVCAEMVFRDLPVAERVRRLTALDVQVEIWDWTTHDLDELEALRDEGAVYSSMTGYVTGRPGRAGRRLRPAHHRGAVHPGGQAARHPAAQPARHRSRRRRACR